MLNIMQHFCICSYLATGDSYLTLSARFRVGLSTIHSIINETCLAIWHALAQEVMPTPDRRKWEKLRKDFECVGGSPIAWGRLMVNTL